MISFDGTSREVLQLAREGRIACIAECNPLHGPRVRALIEMLERGETPEKFNYVEERIFSALPEVREITVNGQRCEVEEP